MLYKYVIGLLVNIYVHVYICYNIYTRVLSIQ